MPTHKRLIASLLSHDEIVKKAEQTRIICGVYFLIREGKVVYVGQSINIFARVRRHVHLNLKRFEQFAYVEVDPKELDEMEAAYIRHLRPEYNRTHHHEFPEKVRRMKARKARRQAAAAEKKARREQGKKQAKEAEERKKTSDWATSVLIKMRGYGKLEVPYLDEETGEITYGPLISQ